MENDNQKVIFSMPEETTPAKTILDILTRNGVEDPDDDLDNEGKTPKLVTVNNAAKDFFEKKITEEKMSELFQKELKISKENAAGIINDIKERLIPLAKKITIPSGKEQVKTPENLEAMPKIGTPIEVEEAIKGKKITEETAEPKKSGKMKAPTREDADVPVSTKSKIKKTTEIKEDLKPDVKQRMGPDTYREPIE